MAPGRPHFRQVRYLWYVGIAGKRNGGGWAGRQTGARRPPMMPDQTDEIASQETQITGRGEGGHHLAIQDYAVRKLVE
jgi:hypothetical protein